MKGVVSGVLVFAALVSLRAGADHPGLKSYETHCARCHGAEGRGGNGPRLVPFIFSYEQALEQIRHPVCDMPAMPATQLSDEDVAKIVAYLQSIE